MISTTLEVVGSALVIIAGFLVCVPLGLAAIGILALLAGMLGDE